MPLRWLLIAVWFGESETLRLLGSTAVAGSRHGFRRFALLQSSEASTRPPLSTAFVEPDNQCTNAKVAASLGNLLVNEDSGRFGPVQVSVPVPMLVFLGCVAVTHRTSEHRLRRSMGRWLDLVMWWRSGGGGGGGGGDVAAGAGGMRARPCAYRTCSRRGSAGCMVQADLCMSAACVRARASV